MPKYTPNLNIQLADTTTDGASTFNVETMINDPIEVLDEALGLVPVSADVRVATTGNITLSALQTIDGVVLAAGNRVLVKNQTIASQNGIYTAVAGTWTRSVDNNSSAKLAAGLCVYVEDGTANGKSRWQMTNTGAVTVGTTGLVFEKVGGPGAVTDAMVGNRTIVDSTAPSGDTGAVTTLFGWLANMVKAITGKSSWRTAPATTLEAAATHAADTTAHITAAERTAWNAKASTSAATTSASGLMSAADKSKLDGVAALAGTAGSATDSVIGSRTIADSTAPTGDSGAVTTLLGWLANMVKAITGKSSWRTPPATTLEAAATHIADTTAHITSAERTAWNAKASTATVTTSAIGLMSAADKSKLDGVAAGANAYTHPNHTGDVTSAGDGVTAISPGVIVDADVNSAAAIAWTKISKSGASLADLTTRSAGDLSSGTLPAARLPAISGDITMAAGSNSAVITAGVIVNADVNASAAIDVSKIGTGTITDTSSPTGDSGSLTTLLGWIGYMVRAITGKSNWRTAPRTTLENTVKRDGDTMTGVLTAPAVAAVNDGDAIMTLEDAGAPNTSFRIKQIFSSRNVSNGNSWLFRSVRPIDAKINDVQLNPIEGVNAVISLCTYADMAFYVRTDGNDSNSGLANTAAGAFKTINKAVSMIPKNINHNVYVHVAAGTYSEAVSLNGFYGEGTIYLYGSTALADTHYVTSVTARNNYVNTIIRGINGKATTSSAFYIYNCGNIFMQYCKVVEPESFGTYAVWVEQARAFLNTCMFTNRSTAVTAQVGAHVLCQAISGAAYTYRFVAVFGGVIAIDVCTITGIDYTGQGGIINTSGVTNPWGDNTLIQRSFVHAYPSAANQSISASTWTKVLLDSKFMDHLGEWNQTTSTFTVSQTGVYLITANAFFSSVPSGTRICSRLWVGGATEAWISDDTSYSASTSPFMSGNTVPCYLSAGTTVEFQLYCNKAVTTLQQSHTRFLAMRIV